MEGQGKQHPLFLLNDRLYFPPVEHANSEGLLAVGGDLSPDPRMVLFPKRIKVSKSMAKVLRQGTFHLTENRCFERVMEHCAEIPRKGQKGTW